MGDPSGIIIKYNGRRLLISKPDTYHALVQATRSLFNLGSNTVVTFYYHPDWTDEECEVTASGFCIVENHGLLRVVRDTANANSPPQSPDTKIKERSWSRSSSMVTPTRHSQTVKSEQKQPIEAPQPQTITMRVRHSACPPSRDPVLTNKLTQHRDLVVRLRRHPSLTLHDHR